MREQTRIQRAARVALAEVKELLSLAAVRVDYLLGLRVGVQELAYRVLAVDVEFAFLGVGRGLHGVVSVKGGYFMECNAAENARFTTLENRLIRAVAVLARYLNLTNAESLIVGLGVEFW